METWTPCLPPSETIAWLTPFLILAITGSGCVCGWLKVRRGFRAGDTRKIFHFTVFTCATVLSLTLGIAAVNLLGGLMAIYIFTVVRVGESNLVYEGIARVASQESPSDF